MKCVYSDTKFEAGLYESVWNVCDKDEDTFLEFLLAWSIIVHHHDEEDRGVSALITY